MAGCAAPNVSALADRVAAYRVDQSQRVTRLNTFFNDNYKQLTQALDDISNRQLLADRDDEAQAISDKLIGDSKTSLRQAFRQAFLDAERHDRDEIDKADIALLAAQKSYQTAHKDLAVPLDKLRKAEEDLRAIAAANDWKAKDQLKKESTFLKWIYSAYKKVAQEDKASKNPLIASNK